MLEPGPDPFGSGPGPVPDSETTAAEDTGAVKGRRRKSAGERLDDLYFRLGERLGRQLFEDVATATTVAPRWTPERIAASVVALSVHGLTFATAGLGLALIVRNWPLATAVIGGVTCFAVAWLVRPRPAPMPEGVVPRGRHLALYALVEEVARALRAPRIDRIALSDEFNASMSRVGWRARPVLTLGAPLLHVLDAQERVALVAHETAHNVNGDPARSFLVGSAVDALILWHRLLDPEEIWPAGGGINGLAAAPFNLARAGVAGVVWAVTSLLVHLLFRESQRAEYLADALSARTSGTAAALSALAKSEMALSFEQVVHTVALRRAESEDLFAALRRRFDEVLAAGVVVTPREAARARLDVAHPPTRFRRAFLEKRRTLGAAYVLSAAQSDRIDREIDPLRPKIQRDLVERYLAGSS